VIIGLVLLLTAALILPSVFTAVSRVVLYPVYATQTWLRESTNSFPTYIRDKAQLEAQIVTLEQELATAKNTDVTLQRLFEENNTLRSLLNSESPERIAAAVIARPNQLPYDYIQIDRGSDHGIFTGAAVYSGVDTVVGMVAHTDEQFALVELFTTPGFEATAFVGDSNVVVTLEGYGAGVARVRVPQGIPLSVGSLVYVPSIEPGVFGRISFVESEPTQPEQYGYITPDKAISSLQYVAVGTSNITPIDETLVREQIDTIVTQDLIVEGVNTTTVEVIEENATTTNPEEPDDAET
jgi:hypothetical protein